MTWTADPERSEATNEHGYKITWAHNKHGTWYNGYAPSGQHIDAGYDKEIVKLRCEIHRSLAAEGHREVINVRSKK